MRITLRTVAPLAGLLLALAGPVVAADQQTSSGTSTTSQADAGYGARSLRGLDALHIEVIGESAASGSEAARTSSDGALKILESILRGSSSKKQQPTGLARDAKSAIQSRTSIRLHEGSLDDARAAGIPFLIITVRDAAADSSGKAPFDLMLNLRQQVVLRRNPRDAFYATTYDARISEPAGGRSKRVVLGEALDRFIEFWRAAN
jgi:hypothetical protein